MGKQKKDDKKKNTGYATQNMGWDAILGKLQTMDQPTDRINPPTPRNITPTQRAASDYTEDDPMRSIGEKLDLTEQGNYPQPEKRSSKKKQKPNPSQKKYKKYPTRGSDSKTQIPPDEVKRRSSELVNKGMNPVVAFLKANEPQWNNEKEDRIKRAGKWAAIGDALRNVMDAAGGAQGADIYQHQNDPLASLTGQLANMRGTYAEQVQDYNENLQGAYENQANRNFREGLQKDQQRFKSQENQAERRARQAANQSEYQRRLALEQMKNELRKDQYKTEYGYDAQLDDLRTKNNMAETAYKERVKSIFDKKEGEDPYFPVQTEEGQPINLSEGDFNYVLRKIVEDPDLPTNIRNLNYKQLGEASGKKLEDLVRQNYDRYLTRDQNGNVVPREKAENDMQQLNSQINQDIQSSQSDSEAVKHIAATLIATGRYSEDEVQQAKQDAQQIYQKRKGMMQGPQKYSGNSQQPGYYSAGTK